MDQSAGRVLLIDDEPPLLKMMGVYLGRRGFDVTTVGATDEAWDLFSAGPHAFAVAVIDATMAGMRMEELARRMLDANSTIRIVAASGYPVNVEALAARAPGRVAFLQKPFSPELLASTVRRMLAPEKESL
jgi:two-component system, cell cycle sensor histidine kinase and response regulator CckA